MNAMSINTRWSKTACSTSRSESQKLTVYTSLGIYDQIPHEEAVRLATTSISNNPLLGTLSTHYLQLCPQNTGQLTEDIALRLRKNYPYTQFRLHAHVQLEQNPRSVDLCDWANPNTIDWFKQIEKISKQLNADAYTAHAGSRDQATMAQVLNYTRQAEQTMGMSIGIAGHAPTPNNLWLMSNWQEYQQLLRSGVSYSLNLSLLHTLACQTGCIEWNLVRELLNNPSCIEVLIGVDAGGQLQSLEQNDPPWWWRLLPYIHPDAVMFAVGTHSAE